eukprot:3975301-Amphidinium_carterae.2
MALRLLPQEGLTVNSRDRLFRHSKGLLDSANCEHACVDHHAEPLLDTPVHRAYFCSASAGVRATVGWTREDEALIFHEGNACVSYGLWRLPRILDAYGETSAIQ